jgi:hypothetical protein
MGQRPLAWPLIASASPLGYLVRPMGPLEFVAVASAAAGACRYEEPLGCSARRAPGQATRLAAAVRWRPSGAAY